VRYFTGHLLRRKWSILDDLRSFEDLSKSFDDDPKLHADWLASHAVTWAQLRDFDQANKCIERSRSLDSKNSWLLACQSNVLGLADRWDEALKCSELAWEIDPGSPFVARSLGNSLLNLRRVQESARRLVAAAENCESYEIAHLACWHQCALAETLDDRERQQTLPRAREISEALAGLAPLADRESRAFFAQITLHIADLANDHQQVERLSREVRSPFYRRVLENIHKNPDGRRIRLPFRHAIQKHEACLPTSLASALAAMGVQIDPDSIASEITFGGTTEWVAGEWLQQRGFAVRFFTVTPEVATALTRNGIAFVLMLEGDASGHAVAVVGLDEAAGTLLVHDPQSFLGTEYLLESIRGMRTPSGPRGMVIVAHDKESLVDELLPQADVEVMTAWQSYNKTLQLDGPMAARAIALELVKRQPVHPGTRLLQAIQAGEDGRMGDALTGFQELLNEFPNSPWVRARLLAACRAVGNTALLREVLASVVERGMLPGIESQQNWIYPPARYVCEFADLLSRSAGLRDRARSLLLSVIRREPTCAEAWHVLGDLLWHEQDFDGAHLPYRLASCLASSNEHYALAYGDSLAIRGREIEGLTWLETRVRTFGSSSRAVATWISWITSLENWGYPDRALSASAEVLKQHGDSPELLSFIVPFLARMGQWEEAEGLLHRLEQTSSSPSIHEAAVDFYRMRGDLNRSIQHAEDWIRELPHHVPARHKFLDLIAKRDGARAAVEQAARWLRDQLGNDSLEELYCQQLDRAGGPRWKKYSLLLRRVKRNSEDGWAWRELTFCCLYDYESANEQQRERWEPRIIHYLAQCDRTDPESAAARCAHAQWHEVRGQQSEAVGGWLEAIKRDPGNFYGYRHIWNCSSTFDAERRWGVWERIEPVLLSCPGRLSIARDTIMLVAQRFGLVVAEQAATKWREIRPHDPEVTVAAADLLLEHGHGRADAERALDLLKPAVARFPHQVALRFSLADACRKLGRLTEAQDILEEIIRRHPDNAAAQVQLASIQDLHGRAEHALLLLQSAAGRAPQNAEIHDTQVQILIRNNRFAEARDLVAEGLRSFPENVSWRERAVRLLLNCGDEAGAIEAARKGVLMYPRVPSLWLLLGITLNQLRRFAAQGEIERCFRRSLALNQSFFDAAGWLAIHLVEQRRYHEAKGVICRIQTRLCDPWPALVRLAWIQHQQGNRREAIEQIASLLEATPWQGHGWSVLMEWLLEDQDWDRARSLLGTIPPPLSTNTQFRRERLIVLEKAGLSANELDSEWNDLLRDFPDDVSLHLQRYDALRLANRLPESAAVLAASRLVDPDSPYVLARLVEVLAEESNKSEAIGVLLRIFFAEVEKAIWPADRSWEAIQKAHLEQNVYQEARKLLQSGARPTPRALSILAAYAFEQGKTTKHIPKPLWRAWFPDRGAREVLNLLNIVDRTPWVEGHHRATLFKQLSDFGYHRLVVNYWKKHRAQVEAEVTSWSEVGRALTSLGRKAKARKLLANWHERTGVSMWVVANYLNSISSLRKEHLREIVSACQHALAGLPHDHCARYLVHLEAEAHALLGDTVKFRETWDKYRSYFDCKNLENEWFKIERRHLLADIPMMIRFLEQNELRLYRKMLWSLRWKHIFSYRSSPQSVNQGSRAIYWQFFLFVVVALQLLRNC
jgi:tetratricopeptide (TPR) repeat protein